MRQLNETGVSSECTCPYCGYEEAMEEYESRGEYEAKWNGQIVTGYTYWRMCFLCGWESVEADDEAYEYIIDSYDSGLDPDDFEDEDEYIEAVYESAPPQEIEKHRPSSQVIKLAIQLQKTLYAAIEKSKVKNKDDLYSLWYDTTLHDMPQSSDKLQIHALLEFRHNMIKSIF